MASILAVTLVRALSVSLVMEIAAAVTPLSSWTQGIATNYGGAQDGLDPSTASFGTEEGSCGYGALSKGTWPYWSVAGISTSNSFYLAGPIEACGQCFEIQCLNNNGQFAGRCNTVNPVSVVVQITDSCPECGADHFDIQALTFNKLAPMAIGRIDTQYRRVECVPPATMVVFIDNNNGPGGWLRLFVEQAGGKAAVQAVFVRTSSAGDSWTAMDNKWGGSWELSNSPSYPLDISISDPDGNAVTAFDVITSSGAVGDYPTTAQFYITNPLDNLLTVPTDGTSSGTPPVDSTPPPTPSTTTTAGIPPVESTPPSTPSTTTLPGIQPVESTLPAPPSTTTTPVPSIVQASPSQSQDISSRSSTSCTCTDVQPPVWSCAEQKEWGKCSEVWMQAGDAGAPNGWCAQTCGRCNC